MRRIVLMLLTLATLASGALWVVADHKQRRFWRVMNAPMPIRVTTTGRRDLSAVAAMLQAMEQRRIADATSGRIHVRLYDHDVRAHRFRFGSPPGVKYAFAGLEFESSREGTRCMRDELTVPIWMLIVGFGAYPATVALLAPFRRRRRLRRELCTQCAYDLTGNTSGICPECGQALAGVGMATDEAMAHRPGRLASIVIAVQVVAAVISVAGVPSLFGCRFLSLNLLAAFATGVCLPWFCVDLARSARIGGLLGIAGLALPLVCTSVTAIDARLFSTRAASHAVVLILGSAAAGAVCQVIWTSLMSMLAKRPATSAAARWTSFGKWERLAAVASAGLVAFCLWSLPPVRAGYWAALGHLPYWRYTLAEAHDRRGVHFRDLLLALDWPICRFSSPEQFRSVAGPPDFHAPDWHGERYFYRFGPGAQMAHVRFDGTRVWSMGCGNEATWDYAQYARFPSTEPVGPAP